jgi:ribosomal protein S18 acetylase RimI-like enzyme
MASEGGAGSGPRRRPRPVLPAVPATAQELPALGRMIAESFEATHPITDEYRTGLLAVADIVGEYRILVVRDADDGSPLAAVAVQRPRRDGVAREEIGFRMLTVHPRARGLGLGRALVATAFAEARAQGVDTVTIYSGPEMVEAHTLYRSAGFTRWPERETRIVDGGKRLLCFSAPVPDIEAPRSPSTC